ncbi:hypothetical protein FBU30_008322 [Linnemannia zychae]|nr:hypothetical protein FBU30_008322 [Linnemannia zychae]
MIASPPIRPPKTSSSSTYTSIPSIPTPPPIPTSPPIPPVSPPPPFTGGDGSVTLRPPGVLPTYISIPIIPQPTDVIPPAGTNLNGLPGENNGSINFRPGTPTTYNNNNNAAQPTSAIISGAILSEPMTGLVFGFAFLGALVIGFIAGFLVARYSRLGGRRREDGYGSKGELTEQLRLLTDTLGQQNQHLAQQYQPNRQQRSYLDEEKLMHGTANQPEFIPLFMQHHRNIPTTSGESAHQSYSSPTLNHQLHQNWKTTGLPYTLPEPPLASTARESITPSTLSSHTPQTTHLLPRQVPADATMYSPKTEWTGSPNTSNPDLAASGTRHPQSQDEGQGEDSLFDIGNPSQNPQTGARI